MGPNGVASSMWILVIFMTTSETGPELGSNFLPFPRHYSRKVLELWVAHPSKAVGYNNNHASIKNYFAAMHPSKATEALYILSRRISAAVNSTLKPLQSLL